LPLSDLDRFVVTGASGFVGRRLAAACADRIEPLRFGGADWHERLNAVRWHDATVLHLAARVHRFGDDDEAAYERDNVEKTRALAEAAAVGGARRIVFLSTIKVNGEESRAAPMRADDPSHPQDAYARSKWRAERALWERAARGTMKVVVVRSPLVVGRGAGGNLGALLALADTPWPLPFAAIANRRTFVGVDDLVALLLRCASVPQAADRTFLAGDPDAVSTPRLLRVLRAALGRAPRLFAAPASVLEAAAALAGARDRMLRLTRSLEVDVDETMRALDWKPSTPMDEVLGAMARSWKKRRA